jgi:hypothetical protein
MAKSRQKWEVNGGFVAGISKLAVIFARHGILSSN